MNIERQTELGTIEIDKVTFSSLLRDAIALTGGRVHLASKAGKMLGGLDKKVSLSEAAQHMYFRLDKMELFWGFYVIVDFGVSISQASDVIFTYLINNLKVMLPGVDGKLAMRVVGVKSKQIAPRSLDLSREYNCDE